MTEEWTWIKLVSQARQGRENAMDLLAQRAQGRVRAYVYRVTLDPDLTEDLSQEVLLQMVQSLHDLHKEEHFWPWLYRVAQNKIKQHYKTKQKRLSLSDTLFYQNFVSRLNPDQHDGLREAVQHELSKKVMIAMKQMRQQYRAVLSLRCFDQLSYADIALAMDCTEVGARVLFYRAKQALKRQLGHQGLKKGVFIACISLFGRLTAPAEAAASTVTISAATTQVGLTAAILGTMSSRLGIAILTIIAAGLTGLGSLSLLSKPSSPSASPPFQRGDVNSFHFTIQLHDPDPSLDPTSLNSKGAYEHWFYLPEEVDGPMFMRMQRWNPQMENKLCAWLQDGQANYYYDSGYNIIHIGNRRVCWSNLRVRRLPTDGKEFIDFLMFVEGEPRGFSEYTRDPNNGLLSKLMDYRFNNAPEFETTYRYNTVGEDFFQYDWPADIPTVDERDPMHKRGWTYFRVNGEVNDQVISGRGCLPFFYNASKDHPAWMSLIIGKNLQIIDCRRGACLRRTDGTILKVYPSGTFFKGLARPWMGLHAADIIRRDAAERRIWFESDRTENPNELLVTVFHEEQNSSTNLIYTIDMDIDIIKQIAFEVQDTLQGLLTFSYLQDIDNVGNEFNEPVILVDPKAPSRPGSGIVWLVHLAEESLGK